jgi:hypothetical protein
MSLPYALFSLISLIIVTSGCKRDQHNPLLGTPDPTVNDVQLNVRGMDNTHLPEMTVLLQPIANSSLNMNDLVLGNFQVLQGGVPLIATSYAPSNYPFSVMIIMDRSGSMESVFGAGPETRAQAANEAASLFIDNLPSNAQVGLVEFHSTVQLTVAMTADKAAVKNAINFSSFGSGGTALYDAIVAGAVAMSQTTGLRVMIILTDGDDTGSTKTPENAIAALLTVGTVASGVIVDEDVSASSNLIMQSIVDATGGTLSTSLDPADLANDLNSVLNGGYFDDIYALTFRRKSSDPNIRVYVSYGTNNTSVDLSFFQ